MKMQSYCRGWWWWDAQLQKHGIPGTYCNYDSFTIRMYVRMDQGQ